MSSTFHLLLFASAAFARQAATDVAAAPVLASRDAPRPGFPYGFLGYLPNIPVNAVAAAVFSVIAIAQTVLHLRYKSRYMLYMTVGAWFYHAGIVFRFVYRSDFNSLGIFLIQNLFIILSPCAFIASVYAILGQLAARIHADHLVPIKPGKITKTFVWSDVLTFLVQAGGGGLQVSASMAEIGSRIFLAGLVLQLISFGFFTGICLRFLLLVRSRLPQVWATGSWRALACAMCIACTGIIVRSIYRIIEAGQGFKGYLAVHEGYFMALDALPLAIACGAFVAVWPERYLPVRWVVQSAVSLKVMDAMDK